MHFYIPTWVVAFVVGGYIGHLLERLRWKIIIWKHENSEGGDTLSQSQNHPSDSDSEQ